MNHIFAQIKGHKQKRIFKLISDKTLFSIDPIITDFLIDYDPNHKLDEDTWFKIDNFSQKSFCLDFLKEEFNSTNYDDLKKADFEKIFCVFAVQEEDFYFQKITDSLFIHKKLIHFGDVATIKEGGNRLVINKFPDAIYLKQQDILVFKNLPRIANIFKGIDELYREATNEEVNSFLSQPFISLDNGFDVQLVSKPNRKGIALALDTLNNINETDRKKLTDYIAEYCSELLRREQDGKFVITNNSELKNLIYGINERFYTTPIGKKKRLANSVQNFGKKENA